MANHQSTWNPRIYRRALLVEATRRTRMVQAETKSFTNPRDRHAITIDRSTLEVTCTCPDFRYRHASGRPTILSDDAEVCKHIRDHRYSLVTELDPQEVGR